MSQDNHLQIYNTQKKIIIIFKISLLQVRSRYLNIKFFISLFKLLKI